jgi:hypothetical protein
MKVEETRCDGCGKLMGDAQDSITIKDALVIVRMGTHTNQYSHTEQQGSFDFCSMDCIGDWFTRILKVRRNF